METLGLVAGMTGALLLFVASAIAYRGLKHPAALAPFLEGNS